MSEPIKIGIGGPVGAGKTQLVERLTRHMSREISMAAITNDIYTIEDAKILAANGILPIDRIIGVETGGCPHTAIREDTSMNTAAIEELKQRHPDLQVIFVESGGDNLSATFSPELVDFSIYIIDVAQGEKIPRKAGQGMIKSDLFIINRPTSPPTWERIWLSWSGTPRNSGARSRSASRTSRPTKGWTASSTGCGRTS